MGGGAGPHGGTPAGAARCAAQLRGAKGRVPFCLLRLCNCAWQLTLTAWVPRLLPPPLRRVLQGWWWYEVCPWHHMVQFHMTENHKVGGEANSAAA